MSFSGGLVPAWVALFGWAALGSLAISMLAAPLGRRSPFLRRHRRAFGLGGAALASIHAAASALAFAPSLAALWSWPELRAGLGAWAILLVLALTSFRPTMRPLRHWKGLHRWVDGAALLVVLHLLGGGAPQLYAAAAMAALLVLRLALRIRASFRSE
ncbi:MAG: ferric reductase-like transmembrane domain-containing protein [Myxococcota bacterium]